MTLRLDTVAARRVLVLALLILVWEGCARAGWIDPFYLPAPSAVAAVIVTLFADGEIWPHLEATFSAAIVGIVVGLVLGIVLGFGAALLPVLAELLDTSEAARALPQPVREADLVARRAFPEDQGVAGRGHGPDTVLGRDERPHLAVDERLPRPEGDRSRRDQGQQARRRRKRRDRDQISELHLRVTR